MDQDEAAMATAVADEMTDAELAAMVPEAFRVHDRPTAEWLVRKVVEADQHMVRVKQQAEREIARTRRERDFLLFRHGPELERWAKNQLDQHQGRRKSVLLLSGTVGFRKLAESLVVENEGRLLIWARKHCKKAIAVIERVSRTTLKQHLAATGELPDGVRIQPAQEKFYIK